MLLKSTALMGNRMIFNSILGNTWKRDIKIGFIEKIRKQYNDHYYFHNNYFKSTLIHELRGEYGNLIKMEYIEGWNHEMTEQQMIIFQKLENELIKVTINTAETECCKMVLNIGSPDFYTDLKYNRLLFHEPQVMCLPVVKIETIKKSGKIEFLVEYVSDDYPSYIEPCYTDPNDPQPYVLLSQDGKALVEIMKISYYTPDDTLIYSIDNKTIVNGVSHLWHPYLVSRGINEAFYRKVLNIAYRLDMDAYIQYLQHFIRFFLQKQQYEKLVSKNTPK